jgi:hypothetical protein
MIGYTGPIEERTVKWRLVLRERDAHVLRLRPANGVPSTHPLCVQWEYIPRRHGGHIPSEVMHEIRSLSPA